MKKKWILVLIVVGTMVGIQANHALESTSNQSVESAEDAMGPEDAAQSSSANGRVIGTSDQIQAKSTPNITADQGGDVRNFDYYIQKIEKEQLSGYTYKSCLGLITAQCQPIGDDLQPIPTDEQSAALVQRTNDCIRAVASTCANAFGVNETPNLFKCQSKCNDTRYSNLEHCETIYTRFSAEWDRCKNQSISTSEQCFQACSSGKAPDSGSSGASTLTTDPMGVSDDAGQKEETVKQLEQSPMSPDS